MGREDASWWRARDAGGRDGGTCSRRDGRMQAGGGHIMPVATMVASAVGGVERAGGGHMMMWP